MSRTLNKISRELLGDGGGGIPRARVFEASARHSWHAHGMLKMAGPDPPDLGRIERIIRSVSVPDQLAGPRHSWGSQVKLDLHRLRSPEGERLAVVGAGYLNKNNGYLTKTLSSSPNRSTQSASRAAFDEAMHDAALHQPDFNRSQRTQLGFSGQVFRANGSWGAPGLVARQVERAQYVQKKSRAGRAASEPHDSSLHADLKFVRQLRPATIKDLHQVHSSNLADVPVGEFSSDTTHESDQDDGYERVPRSN